MASPRAVGLQASGRQLPERWGRPGRGECRGRRRRLPETEGSRAQLCPHDLKTEMSLVTLISTVVSGGEKPDLQD